MPDATLRSSSADATPDHTALWSTYRWPSGVASTVRVTVRRMRRVVVMAEKDRVLLGSSNCVVLANGVDLARFVPVPEPIGYRLLFVGSFRHFPNVTAFRFFFEEVWPVVHGVVPEAELEVVAGPDHLRYWAEAPGTGDGVTVHGFVGDVVPLYERTNLVLAPTLVSAGTNLKVLEAMAMERAVVATPSGCAGLGMTHLESVWIGEGAAAFAEGVITLLRDAGLRARLARAARRLAEAEFDWTAIGRAQEAMWKEL